MAISHEARKKLEQILFSYDDGILTTPAAINDIIAVFDGETNAGQGEREPVTVTGKNEREKIEVNIKIALRAEDDLCERIDWALRMVGAK